MHISVLRFIFILPSLLVSAEFHRFPLLVLLYRVRTKVKMKKSQNCCTIRRSFACLRSVCTIPMGIRCPIVRYPGYLAKPNTLCRLGSARCFHLRPIVTGLIPLAR